MTLVKRYYLVILLVPIIVASVVIGVVRRGGRDGLIISGRAIAAESHVIYLDRFESGRATLADSVVLDRKGRFRFDIKDADIYPMLYELRCGWDHIPIIGRMGQHITVESIGALSQNYQLVGAPLSDTLRRFYQSYSRKRERLGRIAKHYASANQTSEQRRKAIEKYRELYSEIKSMQRDYILRNCEDVASIYALFLRLPGDTKLFDDQSDSTYMNMVRRNIERKYPESKLLEFLRYNIARSL